MIEGQTGNRLKHEQEDQQAQVKRTSEFADFH